MVGMETWVEVIRGLNTYRQALGSAPIALDTQNLVDAALHALSQRMVDPHTPVPSLMTSARLSHALTSYRYPPI